MVQRALLFGMRRVLLCWTRVPVGSRFFAVSARCRLGLLNELEVLSYQQTGSSA